MSDPRRDPAGGGETPRLARLRAAIERGAYEIPAVDVADAIISFHCGPCEEADREATGADEES